MMHLTGGERLMRNHGDGVLITGSGVVRRQGQAGGEDCVLDCTKAEVMIYGGNNSCSGHVMREDTCRRRAEVHVGPGTRALDRWNHHPEGKEFARQTNPDSHGFRRLALLSTKARNGREGGFLTGFAFSSLFLLSRCRGGNIEAL